MQGQEQTDTQGTSDSIPRGRNPVRLLDLLVALGGVTVLVGLGFDWSGGSGYEGLSVLRLLIVLTALAGIAVPLVLAATRKSDVPVVWETLLAPVSSIIFLIVAVKLLLPPEGGAGSGMFITAAGLLLLTASCWKTLSRET